jgi:pyridoxal phosphate enzyme (YggS family)
MEDLVRRITENIAAVQARIATAARQAGRSSADVRLVVVTKAQPVEVVEAALQAGACIVGENYPEETLPKIVALKSKYAAEWHMIGHLQSRKAPIVAEHFDMLQSLDRFDLAEKLQARAAGFGRRLPVLLEFNTGGEESKSGWDAVDETRWPDLLEDVRRIAAMPNLELRGLMTMPPLFETPEDARPFFVRLRQLRDYFQAEIADADWRELSMGTSADFEIAVQEGATLVRIGTAILGQRPPRGRG